MFKLVRAIRSKDYKYILFSHRIGNIRIINHKFCFFTITVHKNKTEVYAYALLFLFHHRSVIALRFDLNISNIVVPSMNIDQEGSFIKYSTRMPYPPLILSTPTM